MAIDIDSIYQNTYKHYLQAKSNIIEKAVFEMCIRDRMYSSSVSIDFWI